ncbi:MAG: ATP-dependent zinc metalloprotease FtsH, partial [Planctomycetota bacterium]
MAEPQKPGEKGRKPRPFGSFVLFLTIIVVVLIAFSGGNLTKPEELTLDEFTHALLTGQVKNLEIEGETTIVGEYYGPQKQTERFRASSPKAGEDIDVYREWHARARYETIDADRLIELLAASERTFTPRTAWHLVTTGGGTPTTGGADAETDEDGEPEKQPSGRRYARSSPSQVESLYVFGTALPGFDNGKSDSDLAFTLGSGAPAQSIGLKVTKTGTYLPQLYAALGGASVPIDEFSFDLDKEGGVTHGPAKESLLGMLFLWTPWILIFALFLFFMRQMRGQGSGAGVMSFGRSRAQLYTKENDTGITFDDVAGAQEAKEEVREVVEFLKNPGRFTRIGGRIPRGVLLVGSPGCGKTLLAKAIAGEAEVPFLSISGSDFVEMFVGVGASRVRDLFKQARENSPCIIFLDEIDAVGRRRGSGMGGGHDEREQTLNAILVEMDGFSTDEGIIVVAATNRPDVLDPALLRPGRFDREVTIDLPDLEGREAILGVHLRKVKTAESIDVAELARATPGYSGADLAAIVNEAAIMAVLDKKDEIEMPHLEEAAAKVRYGRQKVSRTIEQDDLEITSYHEAGHAIVAAKLEGQDVPHKLTIVPRGRALGSLTMLPAKESYHMQKKRLLGQLAIAFGGRVAEEIFCGDISAGASDDIRRATELARAMVTELGMSEAIGPINY